LVLGLGGGQHLDRDPAAHELVFTQIDAAHAARAEALQNLVLADAEPAVLALKNLFGLGVGQQAVAQQGASRLERVGRQRPGGAQPLQVGVEALFLQHAASADQVQEFLSRGRRRHQLPFADAAKTAVVSSCTSLALYGPARYGGKVLSVSI